MKLPRLAAKTASVALLVLAVGCSSSGGDGTKTDAQYKTEVTTGLQTSVAKDIDVMIAAATELQNAAPTPAGRGWDAVQDKAAIDALRAAWAKVRAPYERIEGAVAPLFPDLDVSMDQRYDGFLEEEIADGKGDANLFDDQGVTGMHAIERILWSNVIPASVVDSEKTLEKNGVNLYVEASFPKTEADAKSFKEKLCAKLVTDTKTLKEQWAVAGKLDIGYAFRGLQGLMGEQAEKVKNAAASREESRYSQRTMADLRENLAGTMAVYGVFRPYILSRTSTDPEKDGKTIDGKIQAGFDKLKAAYAAVQGDAIPAPPATWKAEDGLKQSDADLKTPFGQLFVTISNAVDEEAPGSVGDEMGHAADALGFPKLSQ
ncbi:MAG: EfeM/EfeO family lipoprotein [Polyangiaceae bacterium]|nr:EfeM/EfeO family lipoprotein [Polyangiaceae bacterium]